MRYFFSTGEASGEFAATVLAQAILRHDPQARFEGIGGRRMRAEGFTLWYDHRGWASMGPIAAVPRIPKLWFAMRATARRLRDDPPDLAILVDFGAFNIRLAKRLRAIGYTRPILDLFPPGTWLDSEPTARAVAAVVTPMTAFAHQRDFYRSLGLPIAYFGHPLAPSYRPRLPRDPAPPDGGTVALLPGSRGGEIAKHVPRLVDAAVRLRDRRPRLRVVAGAANGEAEASIRRAAARRALPITIAAGLHEAVADADAAWVASGTAVLECALLGVPAVALYVISRLLVRHARRVYGGRFVTLPNLVLDRAVVPELLQEEATPEALAEAMDRVLRDPSPQMQAQRDLRAALGGADAADRCAAYAVELARSGA